eukprot:1203711-Amphidinium_carterae.1
MRRCWTHHVRSTKGRGTHPALPEGEGNESGWRSRQIALHGEAFDDKLRHGERPNRSGHSSYHCAVLVRSHVACRQVEFECPEGRGCAVRVAGLRSSKVLVVSLYLRTGLGPEQQLDILGAVVELCVKEGCQFLVGGDWQLTPEQLLGTGFLQAVEGVLLRTHHTTCWSGAQRELDGARFLCGEQGTCIAGAGSTRLRELVPALEVSPAGVACRPIGPALQERSHSWSWQAGAIPTNMGQAFAEWAGEVNAWRVQFECGDCPARGTGPRVKWKRLDAM